MGNAQDRAFPPNSCRPVPALCLVELAPTAAKTLELPSTDRTQQGCGQSSLGLIIAKEENVAPVMVARLGQLPDDLPTAWRDNTANDLKELKGQRRIVLDSSSAWLLKRGEVSCQGIRRCDCSCH